MGRTPITRISPARPTRIILAAALFLTVAAHAGAQVVINEILPNPVGTDTGTERIEIYNAGASPVDMAGWAIDDAATIDGVEVRARIPEDFDAVCPGGAVIGPGEFRVLKMQAGAAVLNNTGDDIYLVSNRLASATVVHAVTYPNTSTAAGGPGEGFVWSAIPNGTTNFAWRTPTLCASNGATGDTTPPGAVGDLAAAPGPFPGEIRLTWTAPGDDGATGTASNYEIKVSNAPIHAGNFAAATDLDLWRVEPLPAAGGTPESLFVQGLTPGTTYYFAIEAHDEVPNVGAVSNSPSAAAAPGTPLDPDLGYNAYFGNLHSHSSYSDGVLTPAQAYDFARNTAPTPLDFLAVTDHNHPAAGMQLSRYALGQGEAAAANDDGDFVAIWGQEWGLATQGHVNIYEAPVLFGWDAGQYDVFVAQGDYAGLYTAVLANPPSGFPALAHWCHPASGDFNSMQVTAAGLASVHLICLVNGPSNSSSTTESDVGNTGFDSVFREALRKGYRVSPTADQDNHNATWGASSESRTAVLAAGRTKSEILTSLAAGRNYATQDHNVVVRLSANGHAMGEAFAAAAGIRIAVSVTDPDVGDAVAQIDLYRGVTGSTDAVIVATSTGSPNFSWRERTVFPDGTEVHYYLRIRMADNASIWTGPVYVTYDASTVVGVRDPAATPALTLVASPYPSYGRVQASFAMPRDGHASLVVYDATGRRVATLLDGRLQAGSHRLTWSGRDARGARVSAGVFFMRFEAGDESVTRRVLMLR